MTTYGTRPEYHALITSEGSEPVHRSDLVLGVAKEYTSRLQPGAGETELPDDARFSVRFRFPQDVTRAEVAEVFGMLRSTLTDPLLNRWFEAWEADRIRDAVQKAPGDEPC